MLFQGRAEPLKASEPVSSEWGHTTGRGNWTGERETWSLILWLLQIKRALLIWRADAARSMLQHIHSTRLTQQVLFRADVRDGKKDISLEQQSGNPEPSLRAVPDHSKACLGKDRKT